MRFFRRKSWFVLLTTLPVPFLIAEQCQEGAGDDSSCLPDFEVEVEVEACEDTKKQCQVWADVGECVHNARFMEEHCPRSCGLCSREGTHLRNANVLDDPFELAKMTEHYGTKQTLPPIPGEEYEKVRKTLKASFEYMEDFRMENKVLFENCKNDHEQCAFWASIGECDVNPSYMKINCAPVCQTCAQLDIKARCSFTEDEYPVALKPGDLDALFYEIVNGKWDEFHPVIHSAPKDYKRTNSTSIVDDSNVSLGGPWIVTFDNFLSDEEADRIVELGYEQGYDRSTDVGARKFDGTHEKKVSTGRTSNNAWCMKGCENDPTTIDISLRIGNVTGIPYTYSENFQILRYEETQRYTSHHDYIPHHKDLPGGVRILTFFLYLSDVEEGGTTKFTNLGMEISPMKGRALLWPSVRNDSPNDIDSRTHHEARPVIKGKKYAANLWIHNREFRKAHAIGCTG